MATTERCDGCRAQATPCGRCYEAAEGFARASWDAYCRSGEKPVHIPDRPDILYQDAWQSWQEWLSWVGIPPSGHTLPADEALWA
jgi:hypothetical protein